MAKYTIEITARYLVETDDLDDIQLNYAIPAPCLFEYCESIVGEPEFLDGTFTYELEED